jgi:hypothetical protein
MPLDIVSGGIRLKQVEQSMSKTVTIDGTQYDLDSLTNKARETLGFLRFVDEQIQQKRNEWAIADTARMAYASALKRESKR